MKQINFVRHRRRELTKLEVQDSQNFRYGLYGFLGIVVVLLILMVFRFYFASQLKSTNDSITSIRKSITNKQLIEDEYLIFMKKVQIITDLFGQRREKQQALAYFSSLFDPEVIVSQLSYDADTHTLSFTIRAPSIFSMKKVFDTMRSANVKTQYPTFSISGLSRGIDASYSMAVVLPLPTRPIENTEVGPTLLVTPDDGSTVGTTQELAPESPEEPPL
jgi:hypothetical protein